MTKLLLKILRNLEARNIFGLPDSTFQSRIKDGLISPPISLGDRAVGWLEHELNAVIVAMVAGQSKTEIRALVSALVEDRKNATNEFGWPNNAIDDTTKTDRRLTNQ